VKFELDKSIKRLCFLDAEYNTSEYKGQFPNELISIGLVVYDIDKKAEIDSYYSTVRPKHRLSKYVIGLTGLTDDELAWAPDYWKIIKEIMEFMNKYEVNKPEQIITWGDDAKKLKKDLYTRKYASRTIPKKMLHRLKNFLLEMTENIISVDSTISYQICDNIISLDNMRWLCNLDKLLHHNALKDAEDLMHIFISVLNDEIPADRIEILKRYYIYRILYNSTRRFRGDISNLRDAFNKENNHDIISDKIMSLLCYLDYTKIPELMALRDDMISLLHPGAPDVLTLEEFANTISKKEKMNEKA